MERISEGLRKFYQDRTRKSDEYPIYGPPEGPKGFDDGGWLDAYNFQENVPVYRGVPPRLVISSNGHQELEKLDLVDSEA